MNALGKTRQSSGYNMTLGRLLEGLDVAAPHGLQVTDLVQDSRAATPGCVFLACPGRTTHGLLHAAAAVERGAVAVLWEPGADLEAPVLPERVAAIAIPHLSRHVGELADRFFRSPSADLRVAGITGTNGKTTTAFLLAQASEFLGRRGWYVGTLGHGHPGDVQEAGLTTPDAVTVQRRLAEARDEGASTLGLEVSSHALDQERVAGVHFDTAVFTNLTRDHLDYHGTLEAYGAAKARLFHTPGLRCAVINVRDPFGRELVERLDPAIEKIVFTTANDVWAERGTGWIRVLRAAGDVGWPHDQRRNQLGRGSPAFAARRRVQRREPARRARRAARLERAAAEGAGRAGAVRRSAGTHGVVRRRHATAGAGRLRAFTRRARQGARCGPRTRARPAVLRVRLRRRPRSRASVR